MERSSFDVHFKTHVVVPTGRPSPSEVAHALTWLHERSAQRDAWDGPLAIVVWKKMKVAIHQIIEQKRTGIVCKLVCTFEMYTCWKDLFTPGCILLWRNIWWRDCYFLVVSEYSQTWCNKWRMTCRALWLVAQQGMSISFSVTFGLMVMLFQISQFSLKHIIYCNVRRNSYLHNLIKLKYPF